MAPMIIKKMYIPRKQIDLLERMRDETGISVSEHVRRAIDEYVKEWLEFMKVLDYD